MFFLPSTKGRFPVGVTTFVTPIHPPRPIGSVKLRTPQGSRHNQPNHAFLLDEIAFTAYYPAQIDAHSTKGVPWVIRPLRESLHGFAAFMGFPSWLLWPVIYFFGALLKIPAYPNAPLLSPQATKAESGDATGMPKQWPLVIFSHGLGGGRTVYSQFCSHIAASGRIVLAVEHRDGTGTVCMPRTWNQDGKSEPRTILYLRDTDILWDEDDSITHPMPLREQQLAFRHHEVYNTYSTFSRFVSDDPSLEIDTIDGTAYDRESWTGVGPTGISKIRYEDDVVLAGHSFGGCTVLSLISTKPLDGFAPIPIQKAILLDPWLEPLPTPGPLPVYTSKSVKNGGIDAAAEGVHSSVERNVTRSEGNGSIHVEDSQHPRMLVINSEIFTVWKDHFARLQEVVARWEPRGGRIMTLVGSQHTSFSDFPVLPIIRRGSAANILEIIMRLSSAFLDDTLEDTLREVPTTKMDVKIIGVKKDGKPRKKLIGAPGDVITL